MTVNRVYSENRRNFHPRFFRIGANFLRLLSQHMEKRACSELAKAFKNLGPKGFVADLLHLADFLLDRHLCEHLRDPALGIFICFHV